MGAMLAADWPDLLIKDMSKIYMDTYPKLPVMSPDLYNVMEAEGAYYKTSSVGTVPDHVAFMGRITPVESVQGYDKTLVYQEYAAQVQVQHRLASDDWYGVVKKLGSGLAESANRSREKLGASMFNLAFTYEPTDGDGTELAASDHPSPVSGVPTQTNEGTSSLSASSVETMRLAMADFRDDQNEMISYEMDTILIPINLEQTGWEIINSTGKVDTAENNSNFHKGKYKMLVWKRLTDSNNYFGLVMSEAKKYFLWLNREPIQYNKDSDSDTMISKSLSYYRCNVGWEAIGWRGIFGQLVS